eukprot:scaffold3736_cov27-Tisochrysis_lutea.AAC.1
MSEDASTPLPLRRQRIHFVRHGLGEHNITSSGYLAHDAMLTPEGVVQAKRLRDVLALTVQTELVVSSPLRRCLQTAYHALGHFSNVVLLPELIEIGNMPCNCADPKKGSELLAGYAWDAALEQYDALPCGWADEPQSWEKTACDRFVEIMSWLSCRPENEIVIFGHHDFFYSNLGVSFHPGEVRTFTYSEGELRCTSDLNFRWLVSGGLMPRNGLTAQCMPRLSSCTSPLSRFSSRRPPSMPSLEDMGLISQMSSNRSLSSLLSIHCHASSSSLSNMDTEQLPPRTPSTTARNPKSRSVHGGNVFRKFAEEKMIMNEMLHQIAIDNNKRVHGGNVFGDCFCRWK